MLLLAKGLYAKPIVACILLAGPVPGLWDNSQLGISSYAAC